MKTKILLLAVLLIQAAAFASEPPLTASIKISPDLGKISCALQPGKNISLIWKGVTDKRTSPVVGSLKKKDVEHEIVLASSLDAVVGEAIKSVLKNCGFEIVSKEGSGLNTSVEVVELFAGAKKGFVTGETEAKGSLVLHLASSGGTYDFNMSATKSDKRLKKKDVKQFEEVLTGLLESLVSQIAESPQIFSEAKRLAGKD